MVELVKLVKLVKIVESVELVKLKIVLLIARHPSELIFIWVTTSGRAAASNQQAALTQTLPY